MANTLETLNAVRRYDGEILKSSADLKILASAWLKRCRDTCRD